MDDERYFTFPWMDGGEFESLAELELAYGDNCVDAAIAEVAKLWASRSGTAVPCVGSWCPTDLDLDGLAREWAGGPDCGADEDGLLITGFRAWLADRIRNAPDFSDFVWDRFTEFAFEAMTCLARSIRTACGEDIRMSSDMLSRFRDRIDTQPYYVSISLPLMPDDMEGRLVEAFAEARRPRKRRVSVRIPRSLVSAARKHGAEEFAKALAKQKADERERRTKTETDRSVTPDASHIPATDDATLSGETAGVESEEASHGGTQR